MSTATTRAAMSSTASSSTARAGSFGRRVGEASGSRAGARRGPRVPAGAGRARPARRPRVSVVTYALAAADDADVPKDASAPRRLKIFSVNDGASPREARDADASFERSPAWSVSFSFLPRRARATRRGATGGEATRAPATAPLISRSRRVGAMRDARASRIARKPASRPATHPRLGLGFPGKLQNLAHKRHASEIFPSRSALSKTDTDLFAEKKKNLQPKQCTSSRTSPR